MITTAVVLITFNTRQTTKINQVFFFILIYNCSIKRFYGDDEM
jgi:hypothetical protein